MATPDPASRAKAMAAVQAIFDRYVESIFGLQPGVVFQTLLYSVCPLEPPDLPSLPSSFGSHVVGFTSDARNAVLLLFLFIIFLTCFRCLTRVFWVLRLVGFYWVPMERKVYQGRASRFTSGVRDDELLWGNGTMMEGSFYDRYEAIGT